MSGFLKSKTLIYLSIMFIIIGISSYYFFIAAIIFLILGLMERKREKSPEFKHLKNGDALYKAGKYIEAEQELLKIEKINVLGRNKEAYYLLLMKIALQKDNIEEAKKYMNLVSKQRIYTDIDLMIKLSSVYINMGKYKEAADILLILLKVNRNSSFTLLNLSYCFYKLDNKEESHKYLIKINKDDLKEEQISMYEEIAKNI